MIRDRLCCSVCLHLCSIRIHPGNKPRAWDPEESEPESSAHFPKQLPGKCNSLYRQKYLWIINSTSKHTIILSHLGFPCGSPIYVRLYVITLEILHQLKQWGRVCLECCMSVSLWAYSSTIQKKWVEIRDKRESKVPEARDEFISISCKNLSDKKQLYVIQSPHKCSW